MNDAQILIVGGGPVGSTLALDLASRGISVLVAERAPEGQTPGVKCNHVAARTMEIFRRLGIAQTVRCSTGERSTRIKHECSFQR